MQVTSRAYALGEASRRVKKESWLDARTLSSRCLQSVSDLAEVALGDVDLRRAQRTGDGDTRGATSTPGESGERVFMLGLQVAEVSQRRQLRPLSE